MDKKKLERWAQLLLDTGKRNNLISFKDTKASTVEIVYPDAESFYDKCLNVGMFEIYDPKIMDDEDDEEAVVTANQEDDENTNHETAALKKSEYIERYSKKIKKQNQVLAYAKTPNPIAAIKNIEKKARDILDETGVNVAYMAFGFVHWKESENSTIINKAPLLLVPINLKNESSISPFYIELTEDDVVINPTFNYLLEAQYGITLPEYDDESLTSYLDKTRRVFSKLHWEVSATCKLGVFSFLKINMYHDLLNNTSQILKNTNVKKLLGEASEQVLYNGEETSDCVANEIIDLHTVVDADSSQLEAIEMAKSGRSFVLQGPPGTGKSQTITNMIAECLYDGKKVLFVSEKLAALSVVYDKLKQVGLEEFCLELHSYKSSKKEVIAELCKTLRTNQHVVSAKAESEVQTKAKLQRKLDEYAEELHRPVPGINKSLYQLYESYAAFRNAPDVDYQIEEIKKKNEEYLREAENLLSQYEEYCITIGKDYHCNEWYGLVNTDATYENQIKIRRALQSLSQELNAINPLVKECKAKYSLEMDTLVCVEKYLQLFKIISGLKYLLPIALKNDSIERIENKVDMIGQLSSNVVLLREIVDNYFEGDLSSINAEDDYNKLTKIYSNFFSRLFSSEYRGIITSIRLASKSGKKPNYSEAVTIMKNLRDYRRLIKDFNEAKKDLDGLVVTEAISVDTDWKAVSEEIEEVKQWHSNKLSLGIITEIDSDSFEIEKKEFGKVYDKLSESYLNTNALASGLQIYFDKEIIDLVNMEFENLCIRVRNYEENIEKMENWSRFYILLLQLTERDLRQFVDYSIEKGIPNNQVLNSYQKLFFKHWIDLVISDNPVFSGFSRVSQDRAVSQFKEKDRLQFDISKYQIRAELSKKRPSLDLVAAGSAVSILLREGEKKRKQKSIRRLLEETGELVQTIKPCFLMSPLSVSTFLSNNIQFDTVIFDEASQVFPQDAIGAIYRGKQLIVVGDSKQMPPSNFFASTVEIEDDEDSGDVTDFESILDLCSTVLPQLRLKWHYRSRYEQLINFSNKNFYDNSLVTFPSASLNHKGIGVDYYYVDGLFDRKSHTNRKEAEAIVDLVYKNIDDYPDRSLGVVAFSSKQQDLIDRLLAKRRQEDPSKEWFFKRDDSVKEPFFVKNLETVQGDERDTIIFSVAYGYDVQGRLLHQFGPLNRVGGERRLNVAVTRAKENVQLVSSMHSTDIDLNRTSAEGARLLREYLDYAENGDVALERTITVNPFEQFDSDFEMDVCEFLRGHGFTVDTQVGCSGFRIDLGLRKPNSSDYVLAIECDGATYHSSKNARDRDRLRQEVLERMGWRFYRIWSTDWFRNTLFEKERLLKAATEAVNLGNVNRKDDKAKKVKKEPLILEKDVKPEGNSFPKYRELDVSKIKYSKSMGIQGLVLQVLEEEAPLSEEYLLKRICFLYKREKVTSAVRDYWEADMRGCKSIGIVRKKGFLYLSDYREIKLRIPGDKREIKYIAPEELAAGLHVLIEQNCSVEKEALFKALNTQLGFARLGDLTIAKMEEALKLLKDVRVVDNVVSLK